MATPAFTAALAPARLDGLGAGSPRGRAVPRCRRPARAACRKRARPAARTRAVAADADAAGAAAAVRGLWAAFNSGAFSAATPRFADGAVYHDTLYARPFEGRDEIDGHLRNMEEKFESGLAYVLDDVCASGTSAAARWHVELENGSPLPFARGASTYKLVPDADAPDGWLFTEAYDFPEPTLKAAPIVLPVLSLAVKLLRRFPNLLPPPPPPA